MALMTEWGTPKEIETRRRQRVALWAYAYEIRDNSLVSDAVFDFECYCVDLFMNTDRPDLDTWFRANFEPCTGVWIHKHPELDKIGIIYERYHANS